MTKIRAADSGLNAIMILVHAFTVSMMSKVRRHKVERRHVQIDPRLKCADSQTDKTERSVVSPSGQGRRKDMIDKIGNTQTTLRVIGKTLKDRQYGRNCSLTKNVMSA